MNQYLEAYGLKPRAEKIDKMKPKQCPNCSELNKIDSKFCVKCRMILSYDTYLETVQQQEKEDSYIKQMQKQIDEIYDRIRANENKNK